MTPGRSLVTLLAVLCAGFAAGGCGGSSPEDEAEDREAIEAFLEEYLPQLAEAYRTGEVENLDPYAAEKEQAKIAQTVRELARSGEVLAPELESVRVEDLTVWNEVNAFVTTVEVWDVRTFAVGTERVVREQLGQANRVKYQLKRSGGRWRVFWREIERTYE
ncbi:MAG TPA: IMS domain-containing protein [Thermoanaerobaculia bacterium]|nr:IMS domain-containing protein [Thermoanaerobaculia bacterium]